MSDVIHLLPDFVANQIAAGEVIQRPASVVKELVENSIDAGASNVRVIIVGAGRTSIQVIDNGGGMSGTDARMAFERHATSKISNANDLFALNTMGFRGEALASISAIAHVELRTRREEDELGTFLELSGSRVERQELVQAAKGSSFAVKNLFYNVPARRKFLKSDETELRNIVQEMNRIMLANPNVSFQLYNGDELMYDVIVGTFKQRIISLFGKRSRNIAQKLLKIDVGTSIVNIMGYVGAPELAGKNPSQYFFVNGRYMYHPYFRKAVIHAFERMLPVDMSPMFFISLEIDPATIDVNIHPTKTEIKFEEDKAIWSILAAGVKEALGKFNIAPSIDFEMDNTISMPVQTAASRAVSPASPTVSYNPNYNPFSYEAPKAVPRDWQDAFDIALKDDVAPTSDVPEGCEMVVENAVEQHMFEDHEDDGVELLLYKNKYLCMPVKSGLMMVDVRRAFLRVAYDDIRKGVEARGAVSQRVLFPEVLELNAEDLCLFSEIEIDLQLMGFEFHAMGRNIFSVDAIPAQLGEGANVISVIEDMLLTVKDKGGDVRAELSDIVSISLAQSIAFGSFKSTFSAQEGEGLVGRLFQSANPNYTPDGKTIITIINDVDIESRF